jgi:cyclic pyranopterin phosphate synthase
LYGFLFAGRLDVRKKLTGPAVKQSRLKSNKRKHKAEHAHEDESMAHGPAPRLTHVDANGRAAMVNVGAKPIVRRLATAEGFFVARSQTLDQLFAGQLPKGDGLTVARIAGIQAAKRTDELIPLCHSLPLDHVSVDFERVSPTHVRVVASAGLEARTGVEMEALTAVSVACLTLYDMTKAVDKELKIDGIRLVSKTKTPA